MRVDGADGDGDEPRQVHRLPHLHGHLQAGVDQPARHRVRLVQQRRDQARRGYPRRYEDQEHWKGGWTLTARAGCSCKAGGRLRKLLTIFYNPDLPTIDDYYEPWTYDYQKLIDAPLRTTTPAPSPISALTGRDMVQWGSQLGRRPGRRRRARRRRPEPARLDEQVRMEFEQAFMFYLPRICEHCLNPSCVASCPSGAMYKRGGGRHRPGRPGPVPRLAVLRLRLPVQEGLLQPPHRQGGEVHLLLPAHRGRPAHDLLGDLRGPAALPRAVCSTTRTRSLEAAGDARTSRTCTRRSCRCSSTPTTRRCRPRPREQGIPHDWIEAARRSPVYALAVQHRVALPLHPEYRTLPMVWYIPPLSPVADVVHAAGLRRRRPRPRVRRHRRAAHPGGVPGQPVHRRGRRAVVARRAAQARRDARLHARRAARRPAPTRTCPARSA